MHTRSRLTLRTRLRINAPRAPGRAPKIAKTLAWRAQNDVNLLRISIDFE